MKKINFLAFFVCVASMNTYAEGNLFQPKKEGISEKELNTIVQNKLNEQESLMTSNFNSQISQLKNDITNNQQDQLNEIKAMLEVIKAENEELKKQQANMPKGRGVLTTESTKGYSQEDIADLNAILDNSEEDTMILADDIIRLNKEFGESNLSFVGIIDDHKMYKNADGEYIIKDLDFTYEGASANTGERPMDELK